MNFEMAMNWLLEHNEDPDIDAPIPEETLRRLMEDEESDFHPDPTVRHIRERQRERRGESMCVCVVVERESFSVVKKEITLGRTHTDSHLNPFSRPF